MNVLPFLLKRKDVMKADDKIDERDEELRPRSIHLPRWLWKELDDDAKRCKRSSTKHLEALLTLCFDPSADLEIHKETLASAYDTVSQKRKKVA